MAKKRMFAMKVIDSDAFIEMPLPTQALYFHLCMRADDDGFLNNPRKIMRIVGAKEDDLMMLLDRRFLLSFENGVVVIKHWWMHNVLRKDRYHETQYIEEKSSLAIKENGAYTENVDQMATSWQPKGNQLAPQYKVKVKDNNSIRDTICPSQGSGPSEIQKVVDAWNKLPVSHISKLSGSSKRAKMLKCRIEEYGIEDVLKAVESIARSPFLMGQNNRGWMITFDWFVKPNNFPKVLEGNYLDKDQSGKEVNRMSDEEFAALAAAHEGADEW